MSNQELSTESTIETPLDFSDFVRHNIVKRAFDIAFSFFILLLISPVCLLIALAIKLSSLGLCFI